MRIWNFVLTGEIRSGAGVVLSSVNNREHAVCHANLFHDDLAVRKATHEAYYGVPKEVLRIPEWYDPEFTSPWQYANHTIFDNPKNGETTVGCHIPYATVNRLELYDLFHARWRAGDFSLVQVIRNPVACFISRQQAKQTGIWSRQLNDAQKNAPQPVRLNAEELIAFCRANRATESKIQASCEDRLEVPYRDLVLNYQDTMAKVFDFLELPDKPILARSSCRRLRNRPMLDRVTNWTELKLELPADIKTLIASEDLY